MTRRRASDTDDPFAPSLPRGTAARGQLGGTKGKRALMKAMDDDGLAHPRSPVVSEHPFLSTHNALQAPAEFEINLYISERGGSRVVLVSVYPFHSVEMVKRMLIKNLQMPSGSKVKDICLYHNGTELGNRRTMNPYAAEHSLKRVKFEFGFREYNPGIGIRESGVEATEGAQQMIAEIQFSLNRGLKPKLVDDGTGGTYQMFNTQKKCLAMFKPRDEEAFAPNNPRGHVNRLGSPGFRTGVVSGEGAIREVAAFFLDSQAGSIYGVPITAKVEACHESFDYTNDYDIDDDAFPQQMLKKLVSQRPLEKGKRALRWKEGSLQAFVENAEPCADFDPNLYAVRDVQRIAILDIRVMNLDRNDGNILVQKNSSSRPVQLLQGQQPTEASARDSRLTLEGKPSKYRLVPIDHGLTLPDVMDVNEADLCWYYWPHLKEPTGAAELFHIFSIDADKDARRLSRRLHIRPECLRTMRVSTTLLQIGSRLRLNLFQIAEVMCRSWDDFDKISELEGLVRLSLSQAYAATTSTLLVGGSSSPAAGGILMDLAAPEAGVLSRRRPTAAAGIKSSEGVDKNNVIMHAGGDGFLSDTEKRDTPVVSTWTNDRRGCNDAALLGSSNSDGGEDEDQEWDNSSSEEEISTLTGLPLHEKLVPQPPTGEASGNISESEAWRAGSASQKLKGTGRPTNRGTARLQAATNTMASRRLTASTATRGNIPTVAPVSTWALFDSNGRVVPLNWNNKNFDRAFFDIFSQHLKRHLKMKHPEWRSYPYNGRKVEEQISQLFEGRKQ